MAEKKVSEKSLTFEQSLERLEEIASLLENSNPPLNTALELYSESASLLKKCTELLDNAAQTIKVLEKDS